MSSRFQLFPRRQDIIDRLHAVRLTYDDLAAECPLTHPMIASRLAGYRELTPEQERLITDVIARYERVLAGTGLAAFQNRPAVRWRRGAA